MKNPNKIELQIQGMTCDSCAEHVTSALKNVTGVEKVDLPAWQTGLASVTVSADTETEALINAVKHAGYDAKPLSPKAGQKQPPKVHTSGMKHSDFDLVVIGTGGSGMAAAIKGQELGARVAIVEVGTIGGTCVNTGCVPSKTLIRAAGANYHANNQPFRGIASKSKVVNFKEIIEQKRELVQELRQHKYIDVLAQLDGVQLMRGHAHFYSPQQITVNGETITTKNAIIATGASPFIPPLPGLAESGYLTNVTAFELEELPESLIVLGGRYIALEIAQMFARFGTQVTILQRSSRILPIEEPDLTDALTDYLRQEGITIVTNVQLQTVSRKGKTVAVETLVGGHARTFSASRLLVATGRRPHTNGLGLEEMGVEKDTKGFIKVDDTLQTNIPGVYGAGDVIGEPMYVYTAAYEGALAAENALTENKKPRDYTALPWVIFTDPQVAGVGQDEKQAAEAGINADVARLSLENIPRSLAARNTRGFIKLIRDKATDRIIGARILAPEGGELLMELSLAIKYGITAKELASSFHPYLTLSEGIKLTAIAFGKDVSKLSCCAS